MTPIPSPCYRLTGVVVGVPATTGDRQTWLGGVNLPPSAILLLPSGDPIPTLPLVFPFPPTRHFPLVWFQFIYSRFSDEHPNISAFHTVDASVCPRPV